jgi:hypothetical protein
MQRKGIVPDDTGEEDTLGSLFVRSSDPRCVQGVSGSGRTQSSEEDVKTSIPEKEQRGDGVSLPYGPIDTACKVEELTRLILL